MKTKCSGDVIPVGGHRLAHSMCSVLDVIDLTLARAVDFARYQSRDESTDTAWVAHAGFDSPDTRNAMLAKAKSIGVHVQRPKLRVRASKFCAPDAKHPSKLQFHGLLVRS